jgi:ATP adenylyltransferase
MMDVVRLPERYAPNLDLYHERARTRPCFVCRIVARDPDFSDHHIVYEDDSVIAFFYRWSTQRGYTLVAPKDHGGQATGNFTVDEYLALQRVVCRVAEACRKGVGAERVYVLSLGPNQGNAHVHWHVVPLPLCGPPYENQQFAAVMLETAGALDMPDGEKASLAARIGRRMGG